MSKEAKAKYNKTDKGRASHARWRQKNIEYQTKWRKRNPESVRRAKLKHRYGFVPPPAPTMCEACSRPFSEVSKHHGACVDHDHATGKFRGWLCNDCNLAIGRAGESRDRLQLLINYLDNAALLS
jgi:Recombination endonuclease VII